MEEIAADAAQAKNLFRQRRLDEPLDKYLAAFAPLHAANSRLIASLTWLLSDPVDPEFVASLVRDKDLLTALRYLGAPPISRDDLETLIENKLAWTAIRKDPERAERIRDTMARILDPKRFPWVHERRQPAEQEMHAAILASSVVAAAQRVQTARRSDEKRQLEGQVCQVLADMGLKEVATKKITSMARDAPAPGEFSRACVVGEDEADIAVGLFDHRLLAIECKASNSEINSRKRINKEIGQDAQNWLRRFGTDQIVPAAAIQGVFKPGYLVAAQDIGVVIFWAHRLDDLRLFVESTKT